jgi:NAD(P) transhydrogenase subunit beta
LSHNVGTPPSVALLRWHRSTFVWNPMDAIPILIKVAYLVAAVLFILGLKAMSHPRTAVRGNFIGALGMLLAIVAAIADGWLYAGLHANAAAPERGASFTPFYIVLGLIVGSVIGAVLAYKVKMTAMPQMVALLNGLGGLASVLVAGGDLMQSLHPQMDSLIATGASGLVGAVTFWGSLLAYGKLEEYKFLDKPFPVPQPLLVNVGLLLVCFVFIGLLGAEHRWAYLPLVLLASILGFTLVNPIGGADMPVVIALLNSYSGVAAAMTGFVINNNVLIISGSLVGASGVILSQLMCKAMNRSLANVMFGSTTTSSSGAKADEVYAKVRSVSPDDVAMMLDGAQRVVIVPGYGLAVAQAQHAVRDLCKLLEKRGATVEFAIHPVAGRMPGHMNVLLAEADVPYEQLKEMDAINPTLEPVDVALVIGANDVVNPVARTDPGSPIAGMPIIDIDKARSVVVIKRSLSPGFAKIPNPLFAAENAYMLFADAQQGVLEIVQAIKSA